MDFLTVRPLDILHLRGNRLFGETGSGEAVMPPWPSLFSGALRTRMLVDGGVEFADFSRGNVRDEGVRAAVGRSPTEPGTFRLAGTAMILRRQGEMGRSVDVPCFPCPADLVAMEATGEGADAPGGTGARKERIALHALQPVRLTEVGVSGSFPLPGVPVLRCAEPGKSRADVWLTADGFAAHLKGEPVPSGAALEASDLWKVDARVGIALDTGRRTTRPGKLYAADAVSLAPEAAFLVACRGGGDRLPRDGLVRLGGDGRGAVVSRWAPQAQHWTPWGYLPRGDGFRIVLATPGIFRRGWLPPRVEETGDGLVLQVGGLRARLVAAATGRAEVVSGWDLVRHAPKAALRTVPAGAVYWFERLAGSTDELVQLVADGWWDAETEPDMAWRARRPEGFNSVWFGDWDGRL
ncbi:type III-B CRISPR module-associated protein Cmr3 [Candidatus Binatia bacterium]|nr:type III-B CRISPR module-associated protein Cmr3 [Candidatus Binatia bacterium]